jgi:hypothetical protein
MPYEAVWQISSKKNASEEHLILYNQVLQQVIKQLNFRVDYQQSNFWPSHNSRIEASPVKVNLLLMEPGKSLDFIINAKDTCTYDLFFRRHHYLLHYGDVIVIEQCRLNIERTDNPWLPGKLDIRVNDVVSATQRMNNLLTVNFDDQTDRLFVRVHGDNPAEVFGIATLLSQDYTEARLQLELGIDPDFASQVAGLKQELISFNNNHPQSAQEQKVVREKQAADLQVYFTLLQKEEKFKNQLKIAIQNLSKSKIAVVRVTFGWHDLLATLGIGMTAATLYSLLTPGTQKRN